MSNRRKQPAGHTASLPCMNSPSMLCTKVVGFFIYVNLWSSLLSQSLLHHFKKAKEIKGINYLLKQALFFGAKVFNEEI